MYNRSATVATSAIRRKRVPKELQLGQTFKRTGALPQSPLKENLFLRPTLTPQGFSPFFIPLSPTPLSPSSRGQQIQKLTACLQASGPPEVVFPSFGQLGEQVQQVSSFLDLYRIRARDDADLLKVKSPTSMDGEGEWAPLDELGDVIEGEKASRNRAVRRSRSLSDLKRASVTKRLSMAPIEALLEPKQVNIIVEDTGAQRSLGRKPSGSLEDAKQVILGADAKRMAEFRRRFGTRPRELTLAPLPPPDAPLPSPPPPSALLSVKSPLPVTLKSQLFPIPAGYVTLNAAPKHQLALKSPQAPYWVKPKAKGPPKTPRTLRSERRQGWGGMWTMGSIGQAIGQLKETH